MAPNPKMPRIANSPRLQVLAIVNEDCPFYRKGKIQLPVYARWEPFNWDHKVVMSISENIEKQIYT